MKYDIDSIKYFIIKKRKKNIYYMKYYQIGSEAIAIKLF